MVCAAKLLSYGDSENEFDSDEDCNDGTDDDDGEFEEYEIDDAIFNSDLESIELDGVQVERCAAHVLALGVDDTLSEPIVKKLLEKCRMLAKELRTPTKIELIRSMKLKTAKRDNDTRWNSKYDMVLSLVELEGFCSDQSISLLNESDWESCNIFLEVFKPVKVATKLLQGQNLCLGNFFKIWLDMMLRVEHLTKSNQHTALASCLHKHLTEREEMLFRDNDTLLAALYLDPRFRRVMKKYARSISTKLRHGATSFYCSSK